MGRKKTPLSPKEYAEANRISSATVYRMLNDGRLKAKKVGSQWRIDADALPKQR